MENHAEWLKTPGDQYHPYYIVYDLIFGKLSICHWIGLAGRKGFCNNLEKQDLLKAFSEEAYTFISALFLFHP